MADIRNVIPVARGTKKADLVLKNAQVVDVFSNDIVSGDVAIVDGVIAGVGSYTGEEELDCTDLFVVPGLIDAHAHVESTLVMPAEYARAVSPHGIVAAVIDPHEIANVAGEDGVLFMLDNTRDLPVDFHLMVPSCVPATSFDPSGAVLDGAAVCGLMPEAEGLAEVMDVPSVLSCDDDMMRKLRCAPRADGHAPFLAGNDLNAYAAAGISTDHECSTPEELLDRVSRGMYVQIREASFAQNLEALLPAVNENTVSRCLLCSDDRFIGDIVSDGTIDFAIRKAISLGCDPIAAIRMATINPANCYGFVRRGAIAPGYAADILLVEDLGSFRIERVYKDGVFVAETGSARFEAPAPHYRSERMRQKISRSVIIPPITAQSFSHTPEGSLTGIELNAFDLTTKKVELARDECRYKVAVIERYGLTGDIGIGYVSNYSINEGAIASTVSHDSHNVIVIGDNDADMAHAVEALGTEGGFALCSQGQIVAHLPLPFGGLMSANPVEGIVNAHAAIKNKAHEMGVPESIHPIMALAFLSLPVIPEIRITSKGLFDVTQMKYL